MKHTIDVLDAPGDDLHPAVIPRVCDNDIIILRKEGRAVCTLLVHGISNCMNSTCQLRVHSRCVCVFKVNGGTILMLRPDRYCPMRLKHAEAMLEDL